MDNSVGSELHRLAHIALVITLSTFSVILVALNILLKWESWTIPLCVAAVIGCISMHIMDRPVSSMRTAIYSIILLVEMFYYSVNVDTIFDSTPIVVTVLFLLAITRRRALAWAALVVGYFGMTYHLISIATTEGFEPDTSIVVRTAWHLGLVLIAAIVVDRLIDMINRLERSYEDRIRVLEAANKSASDFLANVSHEIRTPINAVIGLSGVCIEKEENEEIRRNLQDVERAGKNVAEKISDILDYSEIDMDHLAVNAEDYMLSSVLNDLVVQLKPAKPQELELVIDVDPTLPSVMHTDVGKLKKILWHLISNGLKYTKEGGVYVRIYAVEQSYGINLNIEVTDTGIGMTPEELERISERFYQANSGRTRSTSGLGLGMAIVSGFVSALKGFMTVDATPGHGTTVHVSLPQQVVDPSECMTVKEPEHLSLGAFLHFDKFPHPRVREYYSSMLYDIVSGLRVQMHKVENLENLKKLVASAHLTHLFVGEEEYCSDIAYMEKISREILVCVVAGDSFELSPDSGARIMRKPFYCFPVINVLSTDVHQQVEEEGRLTCPGVRALVVDDEPMNLTVATSILHRYGMEVVTVSSGRESIDYCRDHAVDIVFMDHMMPQMDGVEAMKRIRSEAGGKDLPIVALTANAVSTAREMFLSEGFDGFVSKPIVLIELERTLRKVLPKSAIQITYDNPAADGRSAVQSEGPAGREASSLTGKPEGSTLSAAPSLSGGAADGGDSDGTPSFAELREMGVDPDTGLLYCQGDEEFYISVMLQYASDGEEKRKNSGHFLDEENMNDYGIIVHAIKSTSKMIGALGLSDRALKLEEASYAGDVAYIRAHHESVMRDYKALTELILSLYSKTEDTENWEDEILEFAPEDPGDPADITDPTESIGGEPL